MGAWAGEDLIFNVGVHYRRRLFPPEPESVLDGLVGDLLVTLTGNDIDRRLAAAELREGRRHDRITELGPYAAVFFQDCRQSFFHPEGPELMTQVRDHAAG